MSEALLARFDQWIGKKLVAKEEEDAVHETNDCVFESRIDHTPYRIIAGGFYTEDLQLTRLNLHLDADRIVTKVWIG
ncbi:hypothetical protein AC1031_003485 [Aphanomyces cochlioides]|nr:hypothetical protein AC1031_003485 [Aphanomyces cochlioides]